MVWKAAGTIAIAAAVGLIVHPALAQNGRPPPIKLGSPSPSPSPTPAPEPIKIGQPASPPKPAGNQGVLSGGSIDQFIDAGLRIPLKPTTYSWSTGSAPVYMEPVKTHICLLTGLAGDFAGAAERVALQIDSGASGGARWLLTGTGAQTVNVTATCVQKTGFTSGMLGLENTDQIQSNVVVHSGCNEALSKNSFASPVFAAFLREIAGRFRGGGETAQISADGTGMRLTGCSGYVSGAALGIRLNSPTGTKFIRNGIRSSSAAYAAMGVSAHGGIEGGWGFPDLKPIAGMQPLVPVSEGFCGLVIVSGKFQGLGEAVEIGRQPYKGVDYWVLKARSLANDSKVFAAASCLARDQR